ncbi:substrate-binding domain-containing protein [Haloferula sp. A504]|uniref:substrate-binding domain-containing protein n=1 Tax=Haloferula sp. A504 TaxID=3373601 RepID=UPI0031C7BCE4|nr:substrate-binding domain-containing protein [Verrucomicrobiaceae bacterium E54]
MSAFRVLSPARQLAAHLREEILRGGWTGRLPGARQFARDLDVSQRLIRDALRLLEEDGILVNQGHRRGRRIAIPRNADAPGSTVGLFPYEAADRSSYEMVEVQHRLMDAGHSVTIPNRSLTRLGMDVKRISRVVGQAKADAWVLWTASREVLEWFIGRNTPILAYAGQLTLEMPIASVAPDFEQAITAATRRLVELGHRRIVLLTRAGAKPAYFLDELKAHGISTGPYNIPDCGPGPEEFRRCLDSLLAVTPPTALLIDELHTFHAAHDHLARRGFIAPERISLVCLDFHPSFELWDRPLAHVRWDIDALVRRMTRWVDNVSRGREDRRRTKVETTFVEGGTIGPVPGKG